MIRAIHYNVGNWVRGIKPPEGSCFGCGR